MSAAARLVDVGGRPLSSMDAAHEGADRLKPETRYWRPTLRSPDVELLPEWEDLVARTRDLIRNHGIASGAVQSHVDKVIGSELRLAAKPDWRALGLDADWADEWQRVVEGKWRGWADDIDCFCDAARRLGFSGMLAQGYRSYLTSSEMLGTMEWLPRSSMHYATALQMILPDRLSNPREAGDTASLRGGVEMDEYGAPQRYHFRMAHRSEQWMGQGNAPWTWRRVDAYTPWGRRQVIHVFDGEIGQTRGKSTFVSVLSKMRMLDHYQKATLQAAVINSMYAAVIESSLTNPEVLSALGGGEGQSDQLENYLTSKNAFYQKSDIRFGGSQIAHLFPGEKLSMVAPQQPTAAFEQFESATLRHIAAGLNMSYEELTRDYSKTNYSSARASMLESWRFFMGRRHQIASRFASQVYSAWLEEAIDRGDVEIPAGAPGFYQAKSAWCRCKWIGAPRGHIDELKEMNARAVAYHELGITTLEELCMEQGKDYEEVIEQRAREKKMLQAAGLSVERKPPSGTTVNVEDPNA